MTATAPTPVPREGLRSELRPLGHTYYVTILRDDSSQDTCARLYRIVAHEPLDDGLYREVIERVDAF